MSFAQVQLCRLEQLVPEREVASTSENLRLFQVNPTTDGETQNEHRTYRKQRKRTPDLQPVSLSARVHTAICEQYVQNVSCLSWKHCGARVWFKNMHCMSDGVTG